MSDWQPIATAPVPDRDTLLHNHWRCLLQTKQGTVVEGYARYSVVSSNAKVRRWEIRWYGADNYRVEPIYWQLLPLPLIEGSP